MVGGGILQETGTLDDSDITTDTIRLEDGTKTSLINFEITLEDGNFLQEDITPDSSTKVFTLSTLNASTDSIRVFKDGVELNATDPAGDTVWSVSGVTLTFVTAPTTDIPYRVKGSKVNKLLLNSTSGASTAAPPRVHTPVGQGRANMDTTTPGSTQAAAPPSTDTSTGQKPDKSFWASRIHAGEVGSDGDVW